MKNNKFVSNIKTMGVVLSAAFTLNACGNKHLSESQYQNVQHKTDSAANSIWEYRIASGLVDVIKSKTRRFRDINKAVLKIYARDYIEHNVKDRALRKFMIKGVNNEELIFASNGEFGFDVVCKQDIDEKSLATMQYVRRQNGWYNDLMLYLSDKYNEQQLLKSEFFTVVDDKYLKKTFEHNTKLITDISSQIDFPLHRKNTIRTELWEKYVKEEQKQR